MVAFTLLLSQLRNLAIKDKQETSICHWNETKQKKSKCEIYSLNVCALQGLS